MTWVSRIISQLHRLRFRPARGLALLAAAIVLLSSATASAIPKGNARIAVDGRTGEVLVARGSLTQWHPASLTKMMTLYLLFDAIEQGKTSPGDWITLSRNAARQPPSKLGIGQGGRIRVRDAMQAMAIKSANDIAVAVAEHVGGSEANFVRRMNNTAKRLGLTRTEFRNPSGLHHPRQVTTARDMAILAVALLRDHPEYHYLFSQRKFRYGKRTYTNTNRMLGVYEGMDGLKTGYIFKAGFNLATTVERDGRRVIAVVMGANSTRQRTRIMTGVLDQAFARLNTSHRNRITAALPITLQAPAPVPRARPNMAIAVAAAEFLSTPEKAAAPSKSAVVANASTTPSAQAVSIAQAAQAESDAPPPPPLRVATDVPIPTPAPATVAAASPYSIQIGAYRNKGDARRQLVSVIGTLPKTLGSYDPHVTHYRNRSNGTLYRARLMGFESREDAARTCTWLRNRSTDCLIVSTRPG